MEVRTGAMSRFLTRVALVILICTSAKANLISHWTFDEGSGTTAYDSQGSNDGTISGATWSTGQINGALSFDGTDDYVTVDDDTSQQITTNQITLAAWIKLAADVGNTQRRIITKQQSNTICWGFELFGSGYAGSTGNQLVFHDSSGTASYNCISQTHLELNRWYYVTVTDNAGKIRIYIDGQFDHSSDTGYGIPANINAPIKIGCVESEKFFNGLIDDVRFYNQALSAEEIQMLYAGEISYKAFNPQPSNGAGDVNINVVLTWTAGPNAVSHDIYFGTSFDDINDATPASTEYYKGNHSLNENSYDPNILECSVTYYWRIDEVNDVSITKGSVWNFATASIFPSNDAEEIGLNVMLIWAAAQDAASYDIYFGSNFYDVDNADTSSSEYKGNQLFNNRNYNPGGLQPATSHYWRVDTVKEDESVTKGTVWNFTTALFPNFGNKAYNPKPPYGTENTSTTNVILTWSAGQDAVSHNIYFATNLEEIYNATPDSYGIFQGNQSLDNNSYNPGNLQSGTTYHWRIDEVKNDGNATKGYIWNFTTDGSYSCSNESIYPDYWKFYVPRMILIKTPSDVNHYRTNIINYLWPITGWPGGKLPESHTTDYDPANGSEWYVNLDNIGLVDRVERLDIVMDYQLHSYAYLLHPKTSVNRLLIVHQGHSDYFFEGGINETIDFFLEHGFSVMTFWMPLLGENWPATAYGVPGYGDVSLNHRSEDSLAHDEMGTILENSQGSFLRFFVEPVFVGINYVQSQYSFFDISMTGVSGGGWSTHLCAALDPRIKSSFPTAGSLPMFIRQGQCAGNSFGDAEQEWPTLYGHQQGGLKIDGYNSVSGWLDLYILGGYGNGRQQVHILNQKDACCFWGVNYRTFEPYVRDVVEQLGKGSYSVYLDITHEEHKISPNVITNVMYPKLQEGFEARRADFTGDGRVDIYDLAIFADAWLSQTGTPTWNANCDLLDEGQITFIDFAEFAKFWLWQEN